MTIKAETRVLGVRLPFLDRELSIGKKIQVAVIGDPKEGYQEKNPTYTLEVMSSDEINLRRYSNNEPHNGFEINGLNIRKTNFFTGHPTGTRIIYEDPQGRK